MAVVKVFVSTAAYLRGWSQDRLSSAAGTRQTSDASGCASTVEEKESVPRKPLSTRPHHPHPHRPPLSLRLLPAFLIPEFQLLGWMACSNCSWVDNIWRVAHSCPIVSFSPGWPLPGCEGLATRRPCCEYSARPNNLLAGISSGSGAIIIIM